MKRNPDETFMRRALVLAERGRGTTRPNPVVGAVIVRGGRVVAEGFHVRAGEAHAEVNALRALGGKAPGATMYVTLEPCCHVGRTGPCTKAIESAGLARIVVGCRDPNPIVDGRGIARLRRAGVRVEVGVLEKQCRDAIRAYSVWIRERRPLVTLKAAATLDGFIADGGPRARRAPVWITGPVARREAHLLRADHDAVLVGVGTVRADDPRLTVRLGADGRGPAPLRVVLAGRGRVPPGSRVLDGSAPTLVIKGRASIKATLTALAKRDVQSVLVEGGARIHGAFITAGLVDRVAFFFAPRLAGDGVPIAMGGARARPLQLGPMTARRVGPDLLITADVIRG
jgi:diaminohydroxyphosphoribosylaminopyrimidine deaminase/5-amino-6-(5-phosphoribosylamino)uracil reductase